MKTDPIKSPQLVQNVGFGGGQARLDGVSFMACSKWKIKMEDGPGVGAHSKCQSS